MGYLHLSLNELHDLLVSKKVTPLDLAKEAIEKAKNDNTNAFEYICEKEALDFASSLQEPEENNIFWGIPYVLKDNFSTKDIPTCGSSDILNGYVPVFSSEVYLRLLNVKAVLIGKVTLDELAMGGTGKTGHKGITYNPWDKSHKRIVGGSSCGSASACASGIVPFALGSDTGDSVRKPASHACLVGLKPTWGRISRFGLFPFAPSMDHVAYFTRNVLDSAYLLNLLAGRDDKDASSSFADTCDYTKDINNSVAGKKVAVVKEIIDEIKDKDVIKAFNKTLDFFKEEGMEVEYVSVDYKLLQAIYPTYIIISCSEATSNNANLDGIKFGPRHAGNTYQEVMTNARTKGFGELIRRRFVIGGYSLEKENQNELFVRAQKARRLIVDAFNEILDKYDVVCMPAAPSVAPLINNASEEIKQSVIADNYLAFANFGGMPSITLPMGFKGELPFGVNLTSKIFTESKLLNIANMLEKHTGYKDMVAKEAK